MQSDGVLGLLPLSDPVTSFFLCAGCLPASRPAGQGCPQPGSCRSKWHNLSFAGGPYSAPHSPAQRRHPSRGAASLLYFGAQFWLPCLKDVSSADGQYWINMPRMAVAQSFYTFTTAMFQAME